MGLHQIKKLLHTEQSTKITKVKRAYAMGEIFDKYQFDRILISIMYKELKKLNTKKIQSIKRQLKWTILKRRNINGP
jgi:hypothetical protein